MTIGEGNKPTRDNDLKIAVVKQKRVFFEHFFRRDVDNKKDFSCKTIITLAGQLLAL